MYKIRVHGASDDLIEIDGNLREEFGCLRPTFIRFTNGVQIKAAYSPDDTGCWRLDIIDPGHAQLVQKIGEGYEDGKDMTKDHNLKGVVRYSDCIEIIDLLPIEIYRRSDQPIPLPNTSQLIAAKVVKTLVAKDYIEENDEIFDDVLEIIATAVAANLSTATTIKTNR